MHGPPRAPRDRRYSTKAWRQVRELVRERDQRTCQACGRREPEYGRRPFPVDHRDPGADFYDPDGLWLLCWSCNTSKAGMSEAEWRARAVPRPGQERASAPLTILKPVERPPSVMFAYHLHRWGRRPWQVMAVGNMDRSWPMDETCPPDCTAFTR